jgi:hypothetical protein
MPVNQWLVSGGKEREMTRYQRASQIWSLLVCAARERKTYKYGDVAEILGFAGAGVMAQILGCIMWFCDENGFPPLTVLVVNKETGLPGEGLSTLEEVNKDREAVFGFNWFGIDPPQNIDFERVDQNKGKR